MPTTTTRAVAELRQLASGDDQALDQAITACMAQPASLSPTNQAGSRTRSTRNLGSRRPVAGRLAS
jgi:hypothetical protein